MLKEDAARRVATRYMKKARQSDLQWGVAELEGVLSTLKDIVDVWDLRDPSTGTAPSDNATVYAAVKDIRGPISKALGNHLQKLSRVRMASDFWGEGVASSEEKFQAQLKQAVGVLQKAGFQVQRSPRGVTQLTKDGGLVTLFEQGTGWVPGVYQLGIIAGSYGKRGAPEDEAIFPEAISALQRHFKVVGTSPFSKVLRQANKTAGRGNLDASTKSKINRALDRSGLDGNTYYRKAEHGFQKALQILGDFGLEQDGVENSFIFTQPSGRLTQDLAFSNPDDPFSPTSIQNTMLVLTFHQMQSGRYEVIAYLS